MERTTPPKTCPRLFTWWGIISSETTETESAGVRGFSSGSFMAVGRSLDSTCGIRLLPLASSARLGAEYVERLTTSFDGHILDDTTGSDSYRQAQRLGLIGGGLVFLILLLLPAPASLSVEGWRTAAVAILMAIWWMTEAIPIPATDVNASCQPRCQCPINHEATINEAQAAPARPENDATIP